MVQLTATVFMVGALIAMAVFLFAGAGLTSHERAIHLMLGLGLVAFSAVLLGLMVRGWPYIGSTYRVSDRGITREAASGAEEFVAWRDVSDLELHWGYLELRDATEKRLMWVNYNVESFSDLMDWILQEVPYPKVQTLPAKFSQPRSVLLRSRILPAVGLVLSLGFAWLGSMNAAAVAAVLSIVGALSGGLGDGPVCLKRTGLLAPRLFWRSRLIPWSDVEAVRVVHDEHGYLQAEVRERDGRRTLLSSTASGAPLLVASLRQIATEMKRDHSVR